jgi:hypothetical protein
MAAAGTRQVTRDKLAIITAVLPQNLRKSVSNRAEAYQANDHIPLSQGQRASMSDFDLAVRSRKA